jgi:hypothetical protein
MENFNVVDKEMSNAINNITIIDQRQYSLDDQIGFLIAVGNRLGLYDAVDILLNIRNRE